MKVSKLPEGNYKFRIFLIPKIGEDPTVTERWEVQGHGPTPEEAFTDALGNLDKGIEEIPEHWFLDTFMGSFTREKLYDIAKI